MAAAKKDHVAEKVSDATYATAPSSIRELKADEKPDPSTIAHVEILDDEK